MSEAYTPTAEATAYRTLLATRGVHLETLRLRDDGTLHATSPTLLADGAPTHHALAEPAIETLEVGALLGRGGMGEVRVAKQGSLRREVAVKRVLEVGSVEAETALLKEAWAGGALEHPSVVPVHTLTRIESATAVVMKRIAGASWASVMADPAAHPRFTGEGGLEAHLRVMVQVCHAIEFAHERGILHLDLKPENVMIGDLGEVYVLDWGLAAATANGPEWLPPARTMSLPAGTPGYMAPEVAASQSERVGPLTDVYLLGAMLHHVVTGHMPHEADNLFAVLLRAYLDEPPEYGPEIPRGLAAILQRALAREPSERWPSADAMRIAIESYLRHRPAEHFLARAEETLAQLDARLAAATRGDVETESLLAECDVALQEVRREWAEHPRLREAEQHLTRCRARHAIVEERLDAARAWAGELEVTPEGLANELAALAQRIEGRAQREAGLEQMVRELDLSLGTIERRRLFGLFGVLWASLSIAIGLADRSGAVSFGYRGLFVEGAVLLAVLAPFAWTQRARYLANRANRRLWGGLAFVAFAVETFFVATWLAHIRVEVAVAVTPIVYAFGFAVLGMALDRRIAVGVPPLLVASAAAAIAPRYGYDVIGVAGGLATALVLWAWQPARAA